VVSSNEYGDETPGSTKGGEFIGFLRDNPFLKKDFSP
jgi:hypothetical protein